MLGERAMRRLLPLIVLLLAAACGGSSSTCTWPASAQTASDASPIGCSASPRFDLCQQQGDGTEQCRDGCSSSEYALSCDSATPDASLGCKVLPLPTPVNVAVYCCPCSR